MTPPPPVRLHWDMKYESINAIEAALVTVDKLLADIDLRIYVHDNYGKGFMKKCGVSPDAYIQMALQLAYFRDAGRFSLTYEASMTRLFREGRTETVRPCTIESAAWVKAMEDKSSSSEHRIKLLRIACQRHQVIELHCNKENSSLHYTLNWIEELLNNSKLLSKIKIFLISVS